MTGAIILAGGQSRRMGTDKALLRLTPDGPRLIELVLAAVRPLADEIVLSTNRPTAYSWLNLPMAADASQFSGLGPLAGLEAGLRRSNSEYNLVVACDMPFVKPALLTGLSESISGGYDAVVPLNAEGRPEPLCGVYGQVCLPAIQHSLKGGALKMTSWLDTVKIRYLSYTEVTQFDPDGSSFNNLNSPQDLRLFQESQEPEDDRQFSSQE